MTDAEPTPVATLTKNGREDLRIALSEFHGVQLVDVRTWTAFDGKERRPTKKGVSINVERLPALIAALEKARAEAERRGLISSGDRS